MSEEKTPTPADKDTPATSEAETPTPATPAVATETPPPAEAQKTDTTSQSEHMIPKSRFDEINTKLTAATDRLAELETAKTEAQKEQEKATQQALEDEGEWKKLWEADRDKIEKLETARAEAEAEATEARLDALKLKVATELQLPVGLAERLIGDDEEAIRADAAKVQEMLPTGGKPVITETDAQAGLNSNQEQPLPTDAEINEQAARGGVKAEYLKAHLEQQRNH